MTATELPRISIVSPSYNQGRFIRATIESVLSQDYPNLEYVVIDGGSTDSSVDVIRAYAERLSYWVSEADRGQSHAINKGFARTTGEILGWLNSDDRLEPGSLHAVAEAALSNPADDVFVGHGVLATPAGEVLHYKDPQDLSLEGMFNWLAGGDFMQPSTFFRRRIWDRAGPIDEDLHIALDVDLWLRMAKLGRFRKIDRLLSTSLVHDEAKTTAFSNRMVVDCSLVIARHGGESHVRPQLEKLADRLTAAETKLARLQAIDDRLGKLPLYRLATRRVKRLLRSK